MLAKDKIIQQDTTRIKVIEDVAESIEKSVSKGSNKPLFHPIHNQTYDRPNTKKSV